MWPLMSAHPFPKQVMGEGSLKGPRASHGRRRRARLQAALAGHQDALPFPAGCASLSFIKICTHISNTEPEQARRNWKLPEPPTRREHVVLAARAV